MGFKEDLRRGHEVEEEAKEAIKGLFRGVQITAPRTSIADYDFAANIGGQEVTFEVKADFKSVETGLVAVEVRSWGKRGGLNKVKADYIIYKVYPPKEGGEGRFVMYKTEALKRRVLVGDYARRVDNAGDNGAQQLVLYEIDDFISCGMEI